jgi:hypothetical protein
VALGEQLFRGRSENVHMDVPARAREPSDDDDDDDDDFFSPEKSWSVRRAPLTFFTRLRVPCYVCEGSGRLWMTDELHPRGRFVRCVACRGRRTMLVRERGD